MSNFERPTVAGLYNNPAYSQVVTATGTKTVYVSGQISMDADGNLVGEGDLGAQTTQVMHNIGLALAAAGATFDDVVKLTTYVVNYQPEHRAIVSAARSAFLPKGAPPASTLVGVTALAMPGWLIEIEAVAVLS